MSDGRGDVLCMQVAGSADGVTGQGRKSRPVAKGTAWLAPRAVAQLMRTGSLGLPGGGERHSADLRGDGRGGAQGVAGAGPGCGGLRAARSPPRGPRGRDSGRCSPLSAGLCPCAGRPGQSPAGARPEPPPREPPQQVPLGSTRQSRVCPTCGLSYFGVCGRVQVFSFKGEN